MSLQCNQCDKSYPTNALLYQHKQLNHPIPKLVLHNHQHDSTRVKRKLPIPEKNPKKKRISVNIKPEDSQKDVNLKIIDEYDSKDKRKTSETDDGLQIIDKYDGSDSDDPQLDNGYEIIDSYDADDQSDSGLTVVDEVEELDYKKIYRKCIQSKEFLEATWRHKFNRFKKEYNDDLGKKTLMYKEKLKKFGEEMEGKYDSRISQLKNDHGEKIKNLADRAKQEMDEYEKQCQEKIKNLKNHIQSLKDDDDEMSTLTKAIFNCTTIEEIFKIQKLVKNHQFEELVQNHLPTLQNLLLSLSYGILPICQPQRDRVTDDQRDVVEKLQVATRQNAKTILEKKQFEMVNLFAIIKDSIKLARNTYNKYGETST